MAAIISSIMAKGSFAFMMPDAAPILLLAVVAVFVATGLIGWTLSLVPFLAFGAALADQAAARIARLMSAAILTLWGLNTAMRAFGL